MLSALIHGKLSHKQENMEDILTSIVFDILKFLPPEQGILPFLARASSPDGKEYPFAGTEVAGAQVDYTFWPTYAKENCKPCEPDLCLLVRLPTKALLVFIEAKYLSGKSSEEDSSEDNVKEQSAPPVDQLAREWQNLAIAAKQEDAEPILIYLTAGVGCPRDDIEVSRMVINHAKPPFNCVWLSWRHLHEITDSSKCPQLIELNRLLERLNLIFFRGIQFDVMPEIDWCFSSAAHEHSRKMANKIRNIPNFDFSWIPIPIIKWRFLP